MKKKTKIIITSITLAGLMFVYYNYDYKYVPKYSIVENDNTELFLAKYRYGNVYIVKSKDMIDRVKKESFNDIIVLDARSELDPNMEIISSYEITDKEARNDVIEIIMEYEKMFPSEWSRSIESMRLEWLIHNILYDIDYERHRTDNVDFDNSDEKEYNNQFLNKVLKI